MNFNITFVECVAVLSKSLLFSLSHWIKLSLMLIIDLGDIDGLIGLVVFFILFPLALLKKKKRVFR